MAKVRMGVIGAGWWAMRFHMPNLKKCKKAGLVDLVDSFSYRLNNSAVGSINSTGGLPHDQLSDQTLIYFSTKDFVRQDMINGQLNAYFHNGTFHVFRDLSKDDLYPAHATSRSLVEPYPRRHRKPRSKRAGYTSRRISQGWYKAAQTGQTVSVNFSV